MKPPIFLKKYFWDIDFNKLNFQENPVYVAARILEYGDDKAARWLLKNMDKKAISKVVLGSRQLSPKSANFWAVVLGIPKEKVKCLQKSYLKRRRQLWLN